MSYLYVQEAFNLYVGNDDADSSKKLLIANLQLPDMEEITQEHHPGGAIGAIEVGGLGHKALMSKFKSTGWDPQTASQFGIGARTQYPYTAKALARNKNGGRAIGVKAVMWGRLTKVSPNDMKRGDLMGHDHEIKEITHYELYFDGAEKFYWDFFASIWRVDGIVQNQDELTYL